MTNLKAKLERGEGFSRAEFLQHLAEKDKEESQQPQPEFFRKSANEGTRHLEKPRCKRTPRHRFRKNRVAVHRR